MALTIIKPSGGGLGLTSPGTAGNVLVSTGTTWASQEPAATGPKITNGIARYIANFTPPTSPFIQY